MASPKPTSTKERDLVEMYLEQIDTHIDELTRELDFFELQLGQPKPKEEN